MRRVWLGLAWLAVSYAGTTMVAWSEAGPVHSWFVADALYFLPLAALLCWMVRDRVWTLIILAGLSTLAVLEHLLTPLLSGILRPLGPEPSFPPAPAIDYLPIWLLYYVLIGLVIGLVEVAILWPYLRPWWMLPAYKVIGGAFTAFALLWRTFGPVPGAPHAGWDWLAALVGAISIAVLWRFDARAPRLRWPPFDLPRPREDETDPAYAAWMADLERSLEKRA